MKNELVGMVRDLWWVGRLVEEKRWVGFWKMVVKGLVCMVVNWYRWNEMSWEVKKKSLKVIRVLWKRWVVRE